MKLPLFLTCAVAFSATLASAFAQQKTVIQYDCIPNYANWGGVTAAYEKATSVRIPPDMKGSSATMVALEAEKANPQADCAYYSGGIGFQATLKGLHQAYKPKDFDKIPAALKDPDGKWWTVHTAHVAILVNTAALKGKPVPKSFADLLKPEYKGMVVYDDPTIFGTGFTFIYGINTILGGGSDMNAGFDYLKKLDANALNYTRENSYNDLLRGEVPIWINADGNGLKAKYVDKAPIEVVIPAEGTVTMPLVMGMVAGAPHPEETKKYLDWLLGAEAQKIMAASFFQPVMNVDLGPELSKQMLPASAYVNAKLLSLSEMADHADAVKARWLKDVKGGR